MELAIDGVVQRLVRLLSRWARERADQGDRRVGAPVGALVMVLQQVRVERLSDQAREGAADTATERGRGPMLVGGQVDLSSHIRRPGRHDAAS